MTTSASSAPSLDEGWVAHRAAVANQRIQDATPTRYRGEVPLPAVANSWATYIDPASSLAIVGQIGRGKTHLAWQLSRLWVGGMVASDPGGPLPNVVAYRATELFDALRPDAANSPYDVLAKAKSASLLLLDDIAAARPTGWTQERLYELVDERYSQQRPVIITSDVPPSALGEFVGPRVASRLNEICTIQVLDGPDRRRKAN